MITDIVDPTTPQPFVELRVGKGLYGVTKLKWRSRLGTRATRRMAMAFSALLLLTGCPAPAPNGPDSTAPEFLAVVVRLEASSPPIRGEFDIRSADVKKSNLGSDLSIRLIATAGDAESGIRSITTTSAIEWQCSLGRGSEVIGSVTTSPLPFGPNATASPPTSPAQLNVVADPIPTLGCSTPRPGWGPVNIDGFVRVTATNGVGLTVTSNTFFFEYADVGSRS